MTSLIAAALLASQNVRITEQADSIGRPIVVQTVIKVPNKVDTPTALVVAELIAGAQSDMVENSGRSRFSLSIAPGTIQLTLRMPPDSAAATARTLTGALTNLRIDEETVGRAWHQSLQRYQSYWVQSRWGDAVTGTLPTVSNVSWAYSNMVRPNQIVIVARGDMGDTSFTNEFSRSRPNWPGGFASDFPPESPPTRISNMIPGLGYFQWRSTPVRVGTKQWAVAVVAACVLGSGADSALVQVSRFKHGWSYDQEAVLLPSGGGHSLVVTIFQRNSRQLAPSRAEISEELLDYVSRLSPERLSRFRRKALLSVDGKTADTPILIGIDTPYRATIESHVAWSAMFETNTVPSDSTAAIRQVTRDDVTSWLSAQLSR